MRDKHPNWADREKPQKSRLLPFWMVSNYVVEQLSCTCSDLCSSSCSYILSAHYKLVWLLVMLSSVLSSLHLSSFIKFGGLDLSSGPTQQ